MHCSPFSTAGMGLLSTSSMLLSVKTNILPTLAKPVRLCSLNLRFSMAPLTPTQGADAGAPERILRRHQELMRVYSASTRRSASISSETSSVATNGTSQVSLNDLAVLKQKFQFIRDDEVDAEQGESDWQVRMSVRYYRQLFREYALADLSRYEEGKIGLRWRTEMEVIAGKGQFSCGNKRCDKREGLHSYELLFAYVEHGERKRCLVKVRACSECAKKLFYKKMMEMKRKEEKKAKKKRRLEDGAKQKAKRRRQSTPRSDLDSSEASDERSGNGDQDTGGNIHQLCAKINAEQKTEYPVTEKRQASAKGDSGFDELLP